MCGSTGQHLILSGDGEYYMSRDLARMDQ